MHGRRCRCSSVTKLAEHVKVALDRLRSTETVHLGDLVVVMAGSLGGRAARADTVRMVFVP
jgi:phage tail tape-measure protein